MPLTPQQGICVRERHRMNTALRRMTESILPTIDQRSVVRMHITGASPHILRSSMAPLRSLILIDHLYLLEKRNISRTQSGTVSL